MPATVKRKKFPPAPPAEPELPPQSLPWVSLLEPLAEAIGLNEVKICRVMKLLDLPEDLQGKVDAGELSATAAYTNTKKATPKKAKAGAKKSKPFARVIRTSCGVTVELKTAKQPSVEDLAAALREALSVIEADQSKAA